MLRGAAAAVARDQLKPTAAALGLEHPPLLFCLLLLLLLRLRLLRLLALRGHRLVRGVDDEAPAEGALPTLSESAEMQLLDTISDFCGMDGVTDETGCTELLKDTIATSYEFELSATGAELDSVLRDALRQINSVLDDLAHGTGVEYTKKTAVVAYHKSLR